MTLLRWVELSCRTQVFKAEILGRGTHAWHLFRHWLAGEVVEGKRQCQEGDHRHRVVEEEGVWEADGVGLVPCGFVELEYDSEKAHDAAGGDEAGGVERTGGDIAFVGSAGFLDRGVDQMANDAAG